MIDKTRSTSPNLSDTPVLPARPRAGLRVTLHVEGPSQDRQDRAPQPEARPTAQSLKGLLTDGTRIAWTDRSTSAARAFTAGDGFLPGQIIDRAI